MFKPFEIVWIVTDVKPVHQPVNLFFCLLALCTCLTTLAPQIHTLEN